MPPLSFVGQCWFCSEWATDLVTLTRTRMHDDGTAYRCGRCGHTQTRKLGDWSAMYPFFPADIAQARIDGEPDRLRGIQSRASLPPRTRRAARASHSAK